MFNIQVELEGHLLDSLLLPKVMDLALSGGGIAQVLEIEVGERPINTSRAILDILAQDQDQLNGIMQLLEPLGCRLLEMNPPLDPQFVSCPKEGCFPENFYVTNNRRTEVWLEGEWKEVEELGMDGAICLNTATQRVHFKKMWQARAGDLILVGAKGLRQAPLQLKGDGEFQFMDSNVSSEKPKSLVIEDLAKRMKSLRQSGQGKILFVGGPAIIHTGGRELLARLIHQGWIDVLFAGNALAVHDLEADLYGTSLGVSLNRGEPVPLGHRNHLYAINRIRLLGGMAEAVAQGVIQEGVCYELVQNKIPYLLAGSIRDDGPLPEVVTDVMQAQKLMKEQLAGVKIALMVSTLLHSIAVGNLLAEEVMTLAVDINPASVTKLSDRGTHQARGLVMDAKSFLLELMEHLEP